jgi:spermidine synthase
VIFTFQSIYGYVFSWIGLLVACFMAGAALGALFTTKVAASDLDCLKHFKNVDLAIIFFAFGCPLIFIAVHRYLGSPDTFIYKALFLIISFICGGLTGSQFPLANKLYQRNNSGTSRTAGTLYACDLLGGWFGGITGAVVLLPVLGLVGTGITVGLLKLTSLIILITQTNQHT